MKASEFMNSVVTDDVLLEILVRLSDAQTAIKSATVCQRWRSLIQNPDFVRVFTKHHSAINGNKKAVALFNFSYKWELPYHRLSLGESEHYNSGCPPCDLSFMPPLPPPPVTSRDAYPPLGPHACEFVIRACCDDLVLLSSNDVQYFICNWLTKEVVPLPVIPSGRRGPGEVFRFPGGSAGYALVRNGSGSGYRVLILDRSLFYNGKYTVQRVTFDTETGGWRYRLYTIPSKNSPQTTERFISYPIHLEVAVTDGGVLHWLNGLLHFFELIVFDVFASAIRLIPLPANGGFSEIPILDFMHRVRLGTVRGRISLSQMTEFRLRIWELDSDNDTWQLAQDVTFSNERRNDLFLCVLAFDPNDDNAIFVLRDNEIFHYVFDRDKFNRVCQFPPCSDVKTVADIKDRVTKYLTVLTLVHPIWPSSISPFRTQLTRQHISYR